MIRVLSIAECQYLVLPQFSPAKWSRVQPLIIISRRGAMGDRRRRLLATGLLGLAVMLGGCGGDGEFAKIAMIDAGPSDGIGDVERQVITDAARRMTGERDARVHGLSARIAAGEEGLDICGFVDTTNDEGLPLYVELRERDGVVEAQRGQVGATPGKLAKVRFMCRKH